jgi:hypothetical protein
VSVALAIEERHEDRRGRAGPGVDLARAAGGEGATQGIAERRLG